MQPCLRRGWGAQGEAPRGASPAFRDVPKRPQVPRQLERGVVQGCTSRESFAAPRPDHQLYSSTAPRLPARLVSLWESDTQPDQQTFFLGRILEFFVKSARGETTVLALQRSRQHSLRAAQQPHEMLAEHARFGSGSEVVQGLNHSTASAAPVGLIISFLQP